MHRFPCPCCGPRDEPEFRYAGELGNRRPQPAQHVEAETWSAYLFERDNLKGVRREIWVHEGGCGLYFGMERNATTHEVIRAFTLRVPAGATR